MTENKRWIIHKISDNGLGLFDLIDTKTKSRYDYDVSYEICEKTIDLLNYQNKEIEQLEKENEELKQQIVDEFNQSNCITVQKSKIKELEKENLQLNEDLDYYKTKSGSCEEGLFQQDREISRLEKENEQLKKHVDNECKFCTEINIELKEENKQLKQFKKNVFQWIDEYMKGSTKANNTHAVTVLKTLRKELEKYE